MSAIGENFFFMRAKPYAVRKQEIANKVRNLIRIKNFKKPGKKKKKSGNLMKRAQKKFERDPRKNFFLRAKPYGLVKAKNCELQSSQFNKVQTE